MNNPSFVPNQCCPEAHLFCGGQPSDEQLEAFAGAGGRCVVNLRPEAELQGWDEAATVRALDMEYVHIPVAGPGDLSREAAAKLADALQRHGDAHVMIHCASGQRVAALLSLKLAWHDDVPSAEAIARGQRAGLDRLEPAVRARLSAD